MTITPLPAWICLLYRNIPNYTNAEYFNEFTVEEVGNMDMEALDYFFAAEWYQDISENVAGNPPQRPTTDSLEQRTT